MSSRLPLGWVMICGHVNPPQLKTLIEIWSTLWSQYLTFQSWSLLWERKTLGFCWGKICQFWYIPNLFYFLTFFCYLIWNATFFQPPPQALDHWRQRMLQWGRQQLNSDTRECICHIRSHSCHTCATLLSAMYYTFVQPSHTWTRPLFQEEVLRGFLTNFRYFLKYFCTSVLQ